ncbi:MAG: adenosylmethionine decarboxylase [Myxococcota bacterium]
MVAIGSHYILDMYDCPSEVIDDLERVQAALRQAAEVARSTLLGETAHRFEPQGVTALGLLAESHISVHTWPELNYAAADVFSCGEHARPELACAYLAKALRAGRHEIRRVARGEHVSPSRPARAPTPGEQAADVEPDHRDAG